MEFNLRKASIYGAVSFYKIFRYWSLRLWTWIFLVMGSVSLLLYLMEYLLIKFDLKSISLLTNGLLTDRLLLGLVYLLIPWGLTILFFNIYFNYYLKLPTFGSNEQNLANYLDFNSALILDSAWMISGHRNEETVSTDSLLLALVSFEPVEHTFIRLGIDPKELRDGLKKTFKLSGSLVQSFRFKNKDASKELFDLIKDSAGSPNRHGGERITPVDLIISLFDHNLVFQKLMIESGLERNDLESLAVWFESDEMHRQNRKMFWRLDNLIRKPPIGGSWIYGYSKYLNRYATDLTRQFQEGRQEIKLIGRKKTIDQMEQVLTRSGQNNILLVGEPGVGKRTSVLGFTQMIAEGKALPALNYKRVFDLNVPLITSSSKNISEVQNILVAILNEAIGAGNILLVIQDFHNFVGAMEGMGRADISQLLLPYLESSNIQIIADTDYVSYHKYIESRADLTKVLEKIEVSEPTIDETLLIVEEMIPFIEFKYGILVTYGAIKTIVNGADRYITTAPFPEKAIDLLSEVVSHAQSLSKSVIYAQDVNDVVTLKTKIPLGKPGEDERVRLKNLESEMHETIIGQDEAVKAVTQTVQRLRAGLTKRGKPTGVFLFVGPTGVGKTLTAKILAKTYFGSEDKMIRFDMSEYQDPESLDRFLGSLRINEPGQLASKIRDNPYSLILLDEIEKAHKNILNLFLAIFDEGHMTDVFGRKVKFEQNIFIATSNAAADLIRDMVKEGLDPSVQKETIIDALIGQHYFTPEFLNRFDEVVIFHPLTEGELIRVAELLIAGLTERMGERGYLFRATTEIVGYIAKIGYDPQFGARPMQRAVQDKLETVIARKIIDGTINKGEEFSLTIEEINN